MPAFGIPDALQKALLPFGIYLRGIVCLADDEGPSLANGERARSVVLLGNIGGSVWPAFSAWQREHDVADPLDVWSKSVITPLADRFGATPFFPSDTPFLPFQQWAMKAEGLKASPLGILIHPKYGLWHGYRGALGFSQPIKPSADAVQSASPCDNCIDRPCLSACPAAAVSDAGFAVAACRAHLITGEGKAGCMASGCLARNACPVGSEHRYSAAQLRFHMAALTL